MSGMEANYEDSYDAEDGLGGGASEEGGCSSWVWIILGVVVVAVIIVVIVVCCRKKKPGNDATFGVPKKGNLKDADAVKFMESFEKQLTQLRKTSREQIQKIKIDPKTTNGTAEQQKELCKDLHKDIEDATKLLKDAREVNKRVPLAFAPRAAFEAVMDKGDEELKILNGIVAADKECLKFFTDFTVAEASLAKLQTEFDALNATLSAALAEARLALPTDEKSGKKAKPAKEAKGDKEAKKQD